MRGKRRVQRNEIVIRFKPHLGVKINSNRRGEKEKDDNSTV